VGLKIRPLPLESERYSFRMPLSRFAFIVKGRGYSAAEHAAVLESSEFSTRVVGVSDCVAAEPVVRQLVADGVQLIELCGGFTPAEAQALRALVGGRVPIGVVVYSDEQAAELTRLFSKPAGG
jgi:hypothetical protein